MEHTPTISSIICISDLFWDEHWSSEQQLASRFAETVPVLYVERPVSPLSPFTGVTDASVARQFRRWVQGGLRQEGENLYVLTPPPCLPFRYCRVTNLPNQAIRTASIARAMKRLSISRPILWIYDPAAAAAVGKLGEALSVYHCADDWLASRQWWNRGHSIEAYERSLLRKASVVFVTSRTLLVKKSPLARRIYYVPNGVSIGDLSGVLERPGDMVHIPHPVIGCSAVYNQRYDYDLLGAAAVNHREWSFVFVGPVLVSNQAINDLRALPNVYFLGNKRRSELAGYIRHFDVCLIPYRSSAFNDAAFPLKLMEYFVFGKPVVSLRLASVADYQDLVYLYDSAEEFATALQTACRERQSDKAARRMNVAAHNTWEARKREIETILTQHLHELSTEPARR